MIYFCGEKNIYQENNQVYDSRKDLLIYLYKMRDFYHLNREIIVIEDKIRSMSEFLYYIPYRINSCGLEFGKRYITNFYTLTKLLSEEQERRYMEFPERESSEFCYYNPGFIDVHEPAGMSGLEYQWRRFTRFSHLGGDDEKDYPKN